MEHTYTSSLDNLTTPMLYNALIAMNSFLLPMQAQPYSNTLIRAIFPEEKGERVGTKFRIYDFGVSESPMAEVGPEGSIEVLNPAFDPSRIRFILFRLLQESNMSMQRYAEAVANVKAPPGFCAPRKGDSHDQEESQRS